MGVLGRMHLAHYLKGMKVKAKVNDQLDRFKEAAREIGTDDDEAKFNEKLGKLVKPKPADKSNNPDE